MKYTTIKANLINPQGKPVTATIVIRDGFACSTFTDPKLARGLAEAERQSGKDVRYSEELNAIIEKFKDLSMPEIVKIIGNELKKAGGKFKIQ